VGRRADGDGGLVRTGPNPRLTNCGFRIFQIIKLWIFGPDRNGRVVKIIGQFHTLMCKRDRAAVHFPDQLDVVTNLSGRKRNR
jgi:hypothetical protein